MHRKSICCFSRASKCCRTHILTVRTRSALTTSGLRSFMTFITPDGVVWTEWTYIVDWTSYTTRVTCVSISGVSSCGTRSNHVTIGTISVPTCWNLHGFMGSKRREETILHWISTSYPNTLAYWTNFAFRTWLTGQFTIHIVSTWRTRSEQIFLWEKTLFTFWTIKSFCTTSLAVWA